MASTVDDIFEDISTTGSFMLPGMSSPEQASYSRVVRFDKECVLIPKTSSTRSKLPVVLTKSYTLPLWKKKAQHFSDSDVEDAAGASAPPQSPEDNRITIKVPIPTFRRRSSRSPPRTRSVSSSPTIPKLLPSCLVYRSPSVLATSSPKPLSPVRRPSLPIYHRRHDELTVPLRDCCADCERITEQCLEAGSDWKEKFSRGARRRRSASLDPTVSTPASRDANATRSFTPFSTEGNINKDLPPLFATTASAFSITVDEVDKRRKSHEYNMEDTDFIRSLSPPLATPPSPSSSQIYHSSASPFSSPPGTSRYPRMNPRDREASSGSTVSSASTTDELTPILDVTDPRNRLRSSPIVEEDETQLFPLPRRSRSNTPSPSPSPNGSTSFLPVRTSPCLSSTSSKQNSRSSQESILSDSLSRKAENGHSPAPAVSTTESSAISASSTIAPSPSPSLSQPGYMRSHILRLNIPKAPSAEERAATSPISPKGPRPSPFMASKAPSICGPESQPPSAIQVPSTISPSATVIPNGISDQSTLPLPAPPTTPSTDVIPKHFLKPAELDIGPILPEPANNNTKSPSSPLLPNHPPSPIVPVRPSQHKRRLSFTIPFIKAGGAIRDVGADVLKGVSSMSSSGVNGGGGGGGGGGVVGRV